MRITRDIAKSLGFKTTKQSADFIQKLKANGAEILYSIFGGVTFLFILIGVAIFS